jgi:TetR/AcrR family transcriptional regulator, transcriptional repressor for nem operon
MSETVQDRLLWHGLTLFQEQGFHATGIQQIASAAGIPKGSFCHYYKSKQEFAVRVIDRYASKIEAGIQEYFRRTEISPLMRLRAYFEDSLASMKADGISHGCAIGNLLAEIGDTNDTLQQALCEAWERVVVELEAFLDEALLAGTLFTEMDLHRLAGLLLSGWEGALIAMRAQRDTRPIEDFLSFVFVPLLGERSRSLHATV